jgi:hypothetical protein
MWRISKPALTRVRVAKRVSYHHQCGASFCTISTYSSRACSISMPPSSVHAFHRLHATAFHDHGCASVLEPSVAYAPPPHIPTPLSSPPQPSFAYAPPPTYPPH